MVKVCPTCGAFWFGGKFCHKCGPGHDLIDCASPEAEPWVHQNRVNIRAFYWARSAMLLASAGMLVGLMAGLVLYEKAVRAHAGWPGKLGALALIIAIPAVIYWGIGRLYRRQVNKDLKVSGKTTAVAPDMVEEAE